MDGRLVPFSNMASSWQVAVLAVLYNAVNALEINIKPSGEQLLRGSSSHVRLGAYTVVGQPNSETWEGDDIRFFCGGIWHCTSYSGHDDAGCHARLSLNTTNKAIGWDNIGHYNETLLAWSSNVTIDRLSFTTSFRSYSTSDRALFTLTMTSACAGPSLSLLDQRSQFPSFLTANSTLRWTSFGVFDGQLGTDDGVGLANVCRDANKCGTYGGVPLLAYNDSQATVIASPINRFKDVTIGQSAQGSLHWGWLGSLTTIPIGGSYQVLLFSGQGVRKTVKGWGGLLRSVYGRAKLQPSDGVSFSHVSYGTDNGEALTSAGTCLNMFVHVVSLFGLFPLFSCFYLSFAK
jgi:hypothetical protein